jgi:type I restriction enzyme S subunit
VKAGWTTKPLSEVCTFKPQKSEARAKLASEDEVSFVPMENLGIGSKELTLTGTRSLAEVAGSYTYFAEGDVLLAKITPCFENGKLGIARNLVNGIGFGSSEYIVIRPSPEVDADFLYHFLDRETFREEGAKQMTGAVGHKRVPKEYVEGALIPVPTIEEQRRIVTLLDDAFADIATAKANAEKNLQNARELFTRISGSVLAQYASTSQSITLEDLVEPDCSLSYGIVQPGDEVPEGLHIVRPVDMNTDVVMLEGLKRIDPALANSYARTTLKGNDILLCVRGTTGTVALAHSELAGANVTRGIVPIRFAPEKISHQFGYYLLRSEPAQLQIQAKTYGTALQQINIRDLRQLTLPVPAPQDQEIIVQRFSALEEETKQLTAAYANKLTALDDLKKSLLHQAFSGQL